MSVTISSSACPITISWSLTISCFACPLVVKIPVKHLVGCLLKNTSSTQRCGSMNGISLSNCVDFRCFSNSFSFFVQHQHIFLIQFHVPFKIISAQ